MSAAPRLRLLQLFSTPILDQLRLEEALLRSHAGNWCLINRGLPSPAIVMGISGVAERLVHVEAARAAGVPVIRRFTGGGTVVVDDGTLFISFVCNKVCAEEWVLWVALFVTCSHPSCCGCPGGPVRSPSVAA